MSNTPQVIRFERNGPEGVGLEPMELDPADFQSELPEQTLHVYFSDEEFGLTLGVWTTTDMQEAFGPYPGDEFMLLLEGRVAMLDGDGNETCAEEGQTFFIRNAIPTSWKQVGNLRKFFMTYDNPNTETPKIGSADGGVIVLDPEELAKGMEKMETTDPFEIVGDAPVQHDNIRFTNDDGNMFIGMWDSTAFESAMNPFPCHEFVQLLEGTVTITEANGAVQTFTAGDMFFVPMGTVCSWKSDGYVRKYYSILDPNA